MDTNYTKLHMLLILHNWLIIKILAKQPKISRIIGMWFSLHFVIFLLFHAGSFLYTFRWTEYMYVVHVQDVIYVCLLVI